MFPIIDAGTMLTNLIGTRLCGTRAAVCYSHRAVQLGQEELIAIEEDVAQTAAQAVSVNLAASIHDGLHIGYAAQVE